MTALVPVAAVARTAGREFADAHRARVARASHRITRYIAADGTPRSFTHRLGGPWLLAQSSALITVPTAITAVVLLLTARALWRLSTGGER